jgi:ubiquinone/menaquinone biosynthesis C-methylase UbiE
MSALCAAITMFLEQKKRQIFGFNQYEREQFVKAWALGLPATSRVLDVGAGPCHYRPFFAHCIYQAQDFAKYEGLLEGSEKWGTGGDNWSYGPLDYVCDATTIPVPDGSFDAVLCTEVLEHVPDPVSVIREIARILCARGQLLLTAPLGSGLHMEPYHFYGGFTPYWYHKFLPEAGFDKIQVVPNRGFFKYYAQESQRFSILIYPRNIFGAPRYLVAPLWLLTYPLLRFMLPVICHYLDRLDIQKSFTVGYHVTALKM